MAKNGSPHPRVVSLIASATEILNALGAGDLQVARSHECDYPPSVLKLPAITRPKFRVEGSSADVDKAVRSLVEHGLAVYDVNAEALEKLKPDVILTQDQCEVCAVSLADVERAVCQFVHGQPRIVSMRPHTLADIYADIARVADAIGRPEAGKKLVASMQERFAAIAAKVAGRPKKKLAFIEWVDPPMSGGHWMPELIDIAGGVSLFGATGEPSPWITWKEVAAGNPDVILVAPCGYDIEVTAARGEAARPLLRLAAAARRARPPRLPRRRQCLLQSPRTAPRRERGDPCRGPASRGVRLRPSRQGLRRIRDVPPRASSRPRRHRLSVMRRRRLARRRIRSRAKPGLRSTR